jgi:hypothetical protein
VCFCGISYLLLKKKKLRNSGEIQIGIIDTTNVSWSTENVPKCKGALILLYYESKHANYSRSDYFSDEKKIGIPLVQKNPIFLLIAKVVNPKILCRDSPKVGLYYCTLG